MKHLVQATLKSGKIVNIEFDFDKFKNIFEEYRHYGKEEIFADSLQVFSIADVEHFTQAQQEEESDQILTKEQIGANIDRLKRDIVKFERFYETMGETTTTTELSEMMMKPDYTDLAKEEIEIPDQAVEPETPGQTA